MNDQNHDVLMRDSVADFNLKFADVTTGRVYARKLKMTCLTDSQPKDDTLYTKPRIQVPYYPYLIKQTERKAYKE